MIATVAGECSCWRRPPSPGTSTHIRPTIAPRVTWPGSIHELLSPLNRYRPSGEMATMRWRTVTCSEGLR